MKLKDWMRKYEEKAEKYERMEGYQTFYLPEFGFMDYGFDEDAIIIDHTCTNNIHFMHDKARELGRAHGCKRLLVQTHRSPKAYLRLNKCAGSLDLRLSGYRPNGHFYWVFEEAL